MAVTKNDEIQPMSKYPHGTGASDPRTLTGYTPVTTKSQAQAMSAIGKQFAASAKINSLSAAGAAGDTVYFALQTPVSVPAIVSTIEITGQYVNVDFTMFRDGVFTGGSEIGIYNNNDSDTTTADSVFTGGITVTDEGTQSSEPYHLLGAIDVGNRIQITRANAMGDKILAPNTTYIGKFQNFDTVATGPIALRFYFGEVEIIINGN